MFQTTSQMAFMKTNTEATQIFEDNRPRLTGLAYRILGTLAEAEDAVQDTCIKWLAEEHSEIRTPVAWLTTVCSRRALDMLKAAHRSRVDYVGTWLPEPVPTGGVPETEQHTALASSLTTAFMLMLERLSPKERAAYLLYEVFEQPYADIAEVLGMEEAACRKLVSRARGHVQKPKIRHTPSKETQSELLQAFQEAIESGETEKLSFLLSDDIKLASDGGGKVIATLNVLSGKHRILRFISKALHRAWTGTRPRVVELNGRWSLIYTEVGGVVSTLSIEYDTAGVGEYIYIVRNPDKLNNLACTQKIL